MSHEYADGTDADERAQRAAGLIETARPESWSSAIADWGQATFGVATPERALERTEQEWVELTCGSPEEAADVVICLCGYARACGFDLAAAVDAKMRINRERTWVCAGDGTGQHA